jgi:hypothetical protein
MTPSRFGAWTLQFAAPRAFPYALRGRHGMTSVYSACSISSIRIGGEVLNKLDWQGKLKTKFGPGSTTGKSVEHPRFIMSRTGEGIMLEDSEFMVTRCFESSCRFSMENPTCRIHAIRFVGHA